MESFHARFDLPALLKKFPQMKVATIGPETSKQLLALDLKPTVEAKIALPFLIASLKDTDSTNRFVACNILGNYGSEAKEAVPALTELLNDTNAPIRSRAQNALNRIQGVRMLDEPSKL